MTAATIRIFLPDGVPNGLRIAHKVGWTGVALDFPWTSWPAVRARPEFDGPGVYVLINDSTGDPEIYVGEADRLRPRLEFHYPREDDWTRATAFASRDDTLDKTAVKYLESRLYELATRSGRAKVRAGHIPRAPSIGESGRAEAENFLEAMLLIYPTLGLRAFEIPVQRSELPESLILSHHRGAVARAATVIDGFVVVAGSLVAQNESRVLNPATAAMRRRLREQDALVEAGPHLRLARDQVFSSPSAAASFVLGTPANGLLRWKDENGRTLKELRQAEATPLASKRISRRNLAGES